MISLIIPVLNEESNIEALLTHIAGLCGRFETIFVDGGSTDRTVELLEVRVRLLSGPPGRGPQCNLGGTAASGDIFFFLHADCRLQENALLLVERAVQNGAAWGCLKLRFDERHPLTTIGALKSNWRARRQKIVFGDQGIFITRELFAQTGGFPNLPLMEDYQLSLDLKKRNISPMQINSVITASARLFREVGRLRLGWRMHRMRQLYRRGISIKQIIAYYRKGSA